ncbi:MAG: hypothetical protein OEV40_08745 [Acidimicrobiia bacterium]|nr:hypothetical protein [Acidimicrobiia bacterium]
MSSEHPNLSLDGLSTQLRRYGRWLEDRTDVALGPLDLDIGHGHQPTGGRPPRRPRLLAAAAAAAAAVALVAVGVGVVADGSSGPEGVSTATADRPGSGGSEVPTSDGEGDRLVPGPVTDGAASSVGDGRGGPAEPEPGLVDATGGDRAAVEDRSAADPVAEQSATDEPRSSEAPAGSAEEPSGAEEPAPVEQATGQESEPGSSSDAVSPPSTSGPAESTEATWPAGDDKPGGTEGWGPGDLIASPTNGSIINLNATTVIEAHPVSGATTYAFEAWQNDRLVLTMTGSSRQLILASQMISDGPWSMEPGDLLVRATASDASGSVLATGEVLVKLETSVASYPFQPTNPQGTGW